MKSGFLIIGLTGPLGSGCGTVAEFIATQLDEYASEIKRSILPTIESNIGDYYRHLRSLQNAIELSSEHLSLERDRFDIGPQSVRDNILPMKNQFNEVESVKRELNRRLRYYLQARSYLNVFSNTQWHRFIIISMSDMIIKLLVEHIYNGAGGEMKESNILSKESQDIINKFIDNNSDDIIKSYNSIVKVKGDGRLTDNEIEGKLDEERCISFDNLFNSLKILKEDLKQTNKLHREDWLQELGDNIRSTGNPFKSPAGRISNKHLSDIAIEVNKYIKYMRRRMDGKNSDHFIVESFRNAAEINYLRKRYGSFYTLSIYANKIIRKKRREDKGLRLSDKMENRDQGKGNRPEDLHKQNVPGCALISDYAINNEHGIDRLKLSIARILALIEKPGCTLPTTEETFMNLAYSLSVKSACISRQVGAVITNSDGYIIGAGWNDVGSGQIGCAKRCYDDFIRYTGQDSLLSTWKETFDYFRENDFLEGHSKNDCYCFKDLQSKSEISKKIDKAFDKLKCTETGKQIGDNHINEIKKEIKEHLDIKRLEYSRALHAEENAILQVATHGGMGIKGGTIYTTTFPCELCAKKIYQSGIKRIVYTEPYPDSISGNIFLKDGIRNIDVEQFEGVKSISFYKLFKPPVDRKELQLIEHLVE